MKLLIALLSILLCFSTLKADTVPDYINEEELFLENPEKSKPLPEDTEAYNFAFTIYPVFLVYVLFISGEAEYNINNYFSITADIRYEHIFKYEETPSSSYFLLGPGIRVYPFGKGMKGFFARATAYVLTDDKALILMPGYRFTRDNFHMEASVGIQSLERHEWEIHPTVDFGIGVFF